MVPKTVAMLFMSLMVFSGSICAANGLMAEVSLAGGENASRRHGTQVRACVSPSGNLLAFVQHWHGAMGGAHSAGTMTLVDDSTGVQDTRAPDFMLTNTVVSALDSQCKPGVSATLISDCPSRSYEVNWAVYQFPVASCTLTSSYTFLSGNTVVLEEGCPELYPATVSGTVACPDTGASAVGDPHLENVHGERFDLMKPGKHVLINIPRGTSAEDSLLRVEADARQVGGHCADMYFQELNVTGSWAEANNAGGYHYSVSESDVETPGWITLGQVDLKVVHGRTNDGHLYLNMYVKHLGRAGVAVGGLLGEDDHSDAMTPSGACTRLMSLVDTGGQESSDASFAKASFA